MELEHNGGVMSVGQVGRKKVAPAPAEREQVVDDQAIKAIMDALSHSDTECTKFPYWLILDPHQMLSLDVHVVASMITGPFFSREDAQRHLDGRKHAFSRHAEVYCHSGCWSSKYKALWRAAERVCILDDTAHDRVDMAWIEHMKKNGLAGTDLTGNEKVAFCAGYYAALTPPEGNDE
jgi:hypothetical protein